jgi:hypothetical protein
MTAGRLPNKRWTLGQQSRCREYSGKDAGWGTGPLHRTPALAWIRQLIAVRWVAFHRRNIRLTVAGQFHPLPWCSLVFLGGRPLAVSAFRYGCSSISVRMWVRASFARLDARSRPNFRIEKLLDIRRPFGSLINGCHAPSGCAAELTRTAPTEPWCGFKRYKREESAQDRAAYSEAEIEAREAKRGLWRDGNSTPAVSFLQATITWQAARGSGGYFPLHVAATRLTRARNAETGDQGQTRARDIVICEELTPQRLRPPSNPAGGLVVCARRVLAGCRDCPGSPKADVGEPAAHREDQLSGWAAKASNRP